jgi:hypothetical protein
MHDAHDRQLLLRRQILRALEQAGPLPLRNDELSDFVLLPAHLEATELQRELEHLRLWGFITNQQPDPQRPAWWRLTPTGLAQILKESQALDLRLWGRLGSG